MSDTQQDASDSAIEESILYHQDNCQREGCTISDDAVIELAQLRAALATATHTADVWERQHKEIVAELALARQRIAELEQAAP